MPGRPLSDAEIDAYDVVSSDVARRVRVYKIPFIPGGYSGMTLGSNVLLAAEVNEEGESALIAHELVHVKQWDELGLVRFSGQYVSSFAKNLVKHKRWKAAYREVDAEVEARRETTAWIRRKARERQSE